MNDSESPGILRIMTAACPAYRQPMMYALTARIYIYRGNFTQNQCRDGRGDHRTNFLTHFVTRFFPRRLPIRNSPALKLGTPLQLSPCLPFIAIAESLHLSSKVLEPRSVLGRCRRDVTVCARARWRDPPVLPISLAPAPT